MEEKNLNFDEVIDRRNTDCLKFDFAERRGKPADVLPLWVADMDFKTSSLVLDALTERVQHGIFGYTESRESYFEAVSKWMEAHFIDRQLGIRDHQIRIKFHLKSQTGTTWTCTKWIVE